MPREITNTTLLISYGISSIFCLGCGYVATIIGRDSIALTMVGKNLTYVGIATAGATFAYGGVWARHCWNERHAPNDIPDEEAGLAANEAPIPPP